MGGEWGEGGEGERWVVNGEKERQERRREGDGREGGGERVGGGRRGKEVIEVKRKRKEVGGWGKKRTLTKKMVPQSAQPDH